MLRRDTKVCSGVISVKKAVCVCGGGQCIGRSKVVQEELSGHVWDLVSLPAQQRSERKTAY